VIDPYRTSADPPRDAEVGRRSRGNARYPGDRRNHSPPRTCSRNALDTHRYETDRDVSFRTASCRTGGYAWFKWVRRSRAPCSGTLRDRELDRHLSRGRVYPIIVALAPPQAAV